MLDRLMGVRGECPRWLAGLPVEVDRGAEGEDAGGDAGVETGWGAGEVVFELELVFECLDDRFDPLADEADRRLEALGLVLAARPQDEAAELPDRLLELAPGEAFVAEEELAGEGLALEQRESGLALGGVGGDELEVDDGSVGAAEQNEPHPPEPARVGGRVAETAPGRKLASLRRQPALTAGQRCRVEQEQRVVEAGQLAGDRPPERDQ